jgi:hypothetical protein
MEELRRIYLQKTDQPSDINEHMPVLLDLAKECESIAELGVRYAVSTWAFLYGLCENQRTNKELYCVDIEDVPYINDIISLAMKAGIFMVFKKDDSIKVTLPTVDMMFIDTWHVYAHLKRELAFHHERVRKYIVMHDTETDKIHGESKRVGSSIKRESEIFGYPEEEIGKGLQYAIDEFLEMHPEWKVKAHYENNNGLTVLERC